MIVDGKSHILEVWYLSYSSLQDFFCGQVQKKVLLES